MLTPPPPPSRHPPSRLPADVLDAGARFPLLLAGDCAVEAHGMAAGRLADPRVVVETATQSPEPMARIAAEVGQGLVERGWRVRPLETDPLATRLLVTDPATDTERAVDVVKETLWRPPVPAGPGPALSLDDLIGTKVRAVADRGTARDLADVHALAAHWSFPDLEELGRRHAWDAFDLADLQSRLESSELLGDQEFAALGLDDQAVAALRHWTRPWATDIAERLLEEESLKGEDL
ncbi:nucleotidyl transferase AbiEii/AbiGii toxin family protein [Streptomyces sp. NPDC051207]|uniref:nucleotidyl transferase AbiEii/AbiGii toxin family protein n=1 Tax=Streptomyces sp. NPDC051207 TaxID=3154641 RepID=UPI0034306112